MKKRLIFCSVFRDLPVWIQHAWNFAEYMSFGPATSWRVRMCAWVSTTKQEVKERVQYPQILCKAVCYNMSPVKGKVSWPSASTIWELVSPQGTQEVWQSTSERDANVWSASELIFSQTLVSWGLHNLISLTYPTSSERKK